MSSENIAILFAGQGSQYIGMGKDLYENIKECREVFDKGEEILNMNIKDLIFSGNEDNLKLTENAQPAILLTSLAIIKVLEKKWNNWRLYSWTFPWRVWSFNLWRSIRLFRWIKTYKGKRQNYGKLSSKRSWENGSYIKIK